MNLPTEAHEGEVVISTGGSPDAALMEIIARVATDPHGDVDKLKGLLDVYERVKAANASRDFDAAMRDAQADMRPIAADANNPQTKSKYASFAALDRALRPIYTKHGFSLSFDTGDSPKPDHIRVFCDVAHDSGEKRRKQLDMPADGKGAKGGDVMTKTHATGAAVTYGQRYLLKMVFNIAVGEDSDGNDPSPRQMGEAAKRAIEEINACETPADLAVWKKTKSQGVANVVEPWELKEIIALFNRRADAPRKSEEVL